MYNFIQPAWEFIGKGGVILCTIIFVSWITVAIIVERFLSFRRMYVERKKFFKDIRISLKRKKIIEAISICDKVPRPLARVVKVGLLKHDRGGEEIRKAMQGAMQEELPHLERYLPVLGTLVYVAPLLGLLGTVLGMIKVFSTIQNAAEYAIATGVAGGIYEALISTAAGLVVAIPALVAYNYFVSRVDGFILDMEGAAADLTNLLSSPGGDHED